MAKTGVCTNGPDGETREIELKFTLSAEEANRLLARPPWSGSAEPADLHSVYFDTPERDLRRGGFSLRIRKENGKLIQTIKTLERGDAAFAERGEWSRAVRGLKPVLTGRAGELLRPVLGGKPLGRVFTVDAVRHRHVAAFDGAQIEIAVDFGSVSAEGRHQAFCELELELLEGGKAALFSFAREIARAVPLRLHSRTKMERGFALLSGPEGTGKVGKAALSADMPVREAFQRIARGCLRHLLVSEATFRKAGAPEAVHQMRVAIRRLRAAMVLFRAFTRDDLHGPLNAELRWIAEELRLARELDVYIAGVLDAAPPELKEKPDYILLQEEYEERRAQAYGSAAAFLASPRFAHAKLVLAQWIECGAWLAAPGGGTPLIDHAARQLRRRWKRVRREIAHHAALNDNTRHAWRIGVKKLRYACDFFAPLFSGGDASGPRKEELLRRAMRHLASLQDSLGLLNDLAEARGQNPLSDVARQLYTERSRQRDGLLAKIDTDCAALSELMPFWKRREE